MNILILNWRDLKHSWAGGGEIYIFEQAKRWVAMGHEVTVFCGEDIETVLPSQETIDGITIYRKGTRFTVYFWAMWYYIRKFRGKFDILIDVVNGIPFFTPLFSKLPKLCFVYHVHGNQFFYELPYPLSSVGYVIEKYIFPFLYQNVPIIAISQTTKKSLVANGFSDNLITIVHCGIEKKQNQKLNISKFIHPTILYLGRIKKYKRIDLLIKIFPKIIEKVPTARLIIAGWGTEASVITDQVMKSNLRRKITLMGPVNASEKTKLLSKSWVFVNPSIGEGWSMAVIESNLYGTPAVSFDVSGLSESVRHGITGLIANDETNLILHITHVLTQKHLRDRLSQNAKLWATKFNWDQTALKSIRLIKQILTSYEQQPKASKR